MEKLAPLSLKTEQGGAHRPRVLFVCTGNTCRSPMAAAYLRAGGRYDAFSRGIAAVEGDPISENAVFALRFFGIESTPDNGYEGHRAKNVTEADMESADMVVTMTGRHTAALIFAFPRFAGKVKTMVRPVFDPYGGDKEAYKRALCDIKASLDAMFLKETAEDESRDCEE